LNHAVLSILTAFIGYSVLNIAQASQKIGLSLFKKSKVKGLSIWIIATLATSVSIFILLYAVSLGSVSIVGAMAGTGLASLTLFSILIMKEKVSLRELLGVAIILGAAVLIGAFTKETHPGEFRLDILLIFLGIVVIPYSVIWIIMNKKLLTGLLIGGFAGALGGFVPLFQKVSISGFGRRFSIAYRSVSYTASSNQPGWITQAKEILTNPFALIWVILSIVSMVILQFSYKRDKAIRIVPVFSANYIVIPVLGGVIGFNEKLHFVQWLGIVLILLGVFVLTVKFPSKKTQSS
jgi:uncharacterized membrane protein